MAQRTQQQPLQGPAGVSLARESKRAKNAGKEDAKLKAYPRGQTEKHREEADNHAKEARSTREADNHAKEARSARRADSNRSNNSPRTGERSCATAQDKRRKRIHADPVPEMDPDPDPDPGPR